MKTSIRSSLYPTLTGITVAVIGLIVSTQAIAKATINENPLDKVSAVYAGYKTIEANFSFRYYQNEADQTGHGEQGKLWLDAASGSYRISTPTQELISDGKTQWAVLKEADEVQITDMDQQDGSISPTTIFTFFQKGYNHKILADQQMGGLRLTVVELMPQDNRKNFSKILIRINKANSQLYDVTVHDKNKSRYTYQIQQLKPNPAIAEGQFVFDKTKFPGMEIVDLR